MAGRLHAECRLPSCRYPASSTTTTLTGFWKGCARCMASRARTLRRNSTAKAAPARPPRLSAAQNLAGGADGGQFRQAAGAASPKVEPGDPPMLGGFPCAAAFNTFFFVTANNTPLRIKGRLETR